MRFDPLRSACLPLAGACFLTVGAAHVVRGQTTGTTAPPIRAAASLDTMIQPGHREFSRYATPTMCFQAAFLTTQVAERTLWDTAAYAPERDTLPTVAVDAAKACGSRFSVANVSPVELPGMLNLALVLHKDDEARNAAERWLATATDTNVRGWMMYQVVRSYLSARPRRTAAAAEMSRRLDALGNAGAIPRLNAYQLLLEDAKQRFDTAELRRDAMGVLTLDPIITPWQRDNTDDLGMGGGGGILELMGVELYKSAPTAVDNVMQAAAQVKFKWQDSSQARPFLSMMVAPIGQPAAAQPAKYWYGAPAGGAHWPVPGHVSLLVWMDDRYGGYDYSTYAMIRRLHAKFGDSLTIVLMTKTHGYANFTPMPAAQEADSIRAYYLDYLKLPVTVAVKETEFTTLPDGRRVEVGEPPNPNPLAAVYIYGPVVTDKQGRLVGYALQTQAIIEAYVRRALAVQ